MNNLKGFIESCEFDSMSTNGNSRVKFTLSGYTLKTPVDSTMYTNMIKNAFRCGDMVNIQYREGKHLDYMKSGSVVDPQKVYLEWRNDFLTYEGFASYYDTTAETAEKLISRGRKIQNEKTEVRA